MSPRARRRLAALLGSLALSTLLLDQGLQHLALADGEFAGRRVAPYDPPLFVPRQVELAARLRAHLETGAPPAATFRHDAELGWCPTPGGTIREQRYDAFGARVGNGPLAQQPRAGARRVVTVGCSFTLGSEVADDQSWAAQLERARPDLELANLGVEGYGVDQALLRHRRDGRPLAPDEVWLGLLPSAAARATTLYRPAQMHWASVGLFKPRFVVDEAGALTLVPNPGDSLARTYELLSNQAEFVRALSERDPWVRRAPLAWAPRGSSWLHRSGLARLALTALEAGGRRADLALEDPASETRRVVRAVVLALREEAARDGARFRLLVLPGREELEHRARVGRGYWEPLCAELAGEGVEVLDLAPELPDPAAPGFDALWAPGGHYSVEGGRLVAEALARRAR